MTLVKSIAQLEQTDSSLFTLGGGSNFLSEILARLTYFLTLPTYGIPKVDLEKETRVALNALSRELAYDTTNQTTLNNELEKIFLKVQLRYNSAQQILLHQIVSQIHGKQQRGLGLENYQFISPFLPVLHMARDNIEQIEIEKDGSFHSDRDGQFGFKGSKVIWMPFTDYNYQGVATKGLFARFLCHYLGPRFGFRLLRKFKNSEIKPVHASGHWMFWTDVFQHGGLRNNTSKNAVALVLRLSHKYSKETFIHTEELLNEDANNFSLDSQAAQDEAVSEIISFMRIWLFKVVDAETSYETCKSSLKKFLAEKEASFDKELKGNAFQFLMHISFYIHQTFHARMLSFGPILEEYELDETNRRQVIEKSEKLLHWLNSL